MYTSQPLSMFDPWTTTNLPNDQPLHDLVLVTRRVDAPFDEAVRRLDTLCRHQRSTVALDRDWQLDVSDYSMPSRGQRRLRGGVRPNGALLARAIDLEFELSAWSTRSSELFVRPASRHAMLWSGRRLQRYLVVAQASAEQLAAELGRPVNERIAAATLVSG